LKEEKQKMTILINREMKVLIQGITGKKGMFHTKLMKDYGTNIAAGLTPRKYGEKVLDIPVYDTVKEVLENHKIDISGIFVPAKFTKEAAFEAIDAGIKLIVILT
jgi:succinyl-CoA synthetase alpha subunit